MPRIFIGIKLNETISMKRIRNEFMVHLKNEHIKWVDPGNYHVTLKFLGNINENEISTIVDCMEHIGEKTPAFTLGLSNTGLFKNISNPRVLWMGIELNEILNKLNENIEHELLKIGYPKENKSFNPHLTFARVKKITDIPALKTLLAKYDHCNINEFKIENFIVYESILKNKNPLYKELKKIKLVPIKSVSRL